MKYQIVRSMFVEHDDNAKTMHAHNVTLKKRNSVIKLLVLAVSISFVSLNSAVSYAQMTMDGSNTTDTSMDDPQDTTDMTTTETTTTGDSTSVVDLVEGTTPEENTEPEPEPETSSSSGGGGAILALAAVGAVVVIVMNRSQKQQPKIQKTFISDQVAGVGTRLTVIGHQQRYLDEVEQPTISFQFGTYQSVTGLDTPYSFFNFRYQKQLGVGLSLSSDVGTRYFTTNSDDFLDSQWLSLGLSRSKIFSNDDRLAFTARYAVGDRDENSDSLTLNGSDLQRYDALFSDQNAQFELAYSRVLGENQRLRFLVQKMNSSAEKYAAKLAWRWAF